MNPYGYYYQYVPQLENPNSHYQTNPYINSQKLLIPIDSHQHLKEE